MSYARTLPPRPLFQCILVCIVCLLRARGAGEPVCVLTTIVPFSCSPALGCLPLSWSPDARVLAFVVEACAMAPALVLEPCASMLTFVVASCGLSCLCHGALRCVPASVV